ncbi:Proteasome, subunit alpha/beta [Carpediemonas membranifera]|uniref:Proteasome subunit alpha type n=1 Tax=Carpediemonas membranifera TaxID=201153 RepID=A0A8J6B1W4_9EUKA|nr:Proteasome, subunit alpha/beta [Carpediemonas membranifera]|eukprot:KAG9391139.1 Proteasome, subunit alpha/beta [Carpediemonas membranifera]
MSGFDSDRYSFSLTTFSPSGKLGQIDHALAAVNNGSTSIGIKSHDGIVLVTERKLKSALIDKDSIKKVQILADNVGCVYSGIGADSAVLVRSGRKNGEVYRRQFGENPGVDTVAKDLTAKMQSYTQSGGVRPFGCSLLVGGVDPAGPSLWQVDPSGSSIRWKATAIGKNSRTCKTFLEKRVTPDLSLDDAVKIALLSLKEVFDGLLKAEHCEVGIISTEDGLFRKMTDAEVTEQLDGLE